MGKKIQLTESELINLIEKMVKEYDKPAMASFQKQYGKKKGKSVYYATANKQKRNPETFKLKEQEENMGRMEKLVYKIAEETSQDGYDDPYDWMSEVFDSVEWELMDEYDDDELSNLISDLKDVCDDILLSMWGE